MAVDEAILNSFLKGISSPTLRFYRWSPASVSLGYNQIPSDVLTDFALNSGKAPFVRRITGGESIFHGFDLSYSIICRKENLGLSDSVKESFKQLTGFILNAYRDLGLSVNYFCDGVPFDHSGGSNICFARTRGFDISCGGKKLGGNAQKRMKNVIFQHGSVPFEIKKDRMKEIYRQDIQKESGFTCLNEALGREITEKELTGVLTRSFERTFSAALVPGVLDNYEQADAEQLARGKYVSKDWNHTAQAVPTVKGIHE